MGTKIDYKAARRNFGGNGSVIVVLVPQLYSLSKLSELRLKVSELLYNKTEKFCSICIWAAIAHFSMAQRFPINILKIKDKL